VWWGDGGVGGSHSPRPAESPSQRGNGGSGLPRGDRSGIAPVTSLTLHPDHRKRAVPGPWQPVEDVELEEPSLPPPQVLSVRTPSRRELDCTERHGWPGSGSKSWKPAPLPAREPPAPPPRGTRSQSHPQSQTAAHRLTACLTS